MLFDGHVGLELLLLHEFLINVGVFEPEENMGVFEIASFPDAGEGEIKPCLVSDIGVGIAVGWELNKEGKFSFHDNLIFECHSMKIATREITGET